MSEDRPTPDGGFGPLLIGAQVEAYGLAVQRQTRTELAAMLRSSGQARAADLVEQHGDVTEPSRALPVRRAPLTEHAAGCRVFSCRCGCDRAQDCQDCHRCVCWRAECCAQVALDAALRRQRVAELQSLLNGVDRTGLTELREAVAAAEEAKLRRAVAHRTRLLVPSAGHTYAVAVFEAVDSKLGMGHADFRDRGVELYEAGHDQQDEPDRIADLDDDALAQALGALAELLHPEEGARLTVALH